MIEVGIFDTGSNALPWKTSSSGPRIIDAELSEVHEGAQELTNAQIRRAVLADQLGYDYYWNSEHHFNIEGAELSPNPLQTQSAVAALTKRIRLGQLANILPWHHPLRLAEQIATLDIISGGRVECGLGRGYQSRETETFGAVLGGSTQDQERNRSFYEEAIEILLKAWTQDAFSHRGEFFSVPPSWALWNHSQSLAYFREEGRDVEEFFRLGPPDMYSSGPEVSATTTTLRKLAVLPQPLQKPHPPLWEPVTSGRSVAYAASKGFNGNFFLETNEALKTKIEAYMRAAEDAGWPDAVNPGQPFKWGWDSARHRGVSAGKHVHIEAPGVGSVKRAGEAQMYRWDWFKPFGFSAVLARPGEAPDPNMTITPEVLQERGLTLFGSKQQVIEGLLELRDYAYSDGDFIVNVWFEASCAKHEETEEQMQFFAEEVLPVLRRECGGAPERPESTAELTPRAVEAAGAA